MKKIVSIALCAVFVCMFSKADAKILRVGLPGTYSTLQDAVNDCSTNPNKPDTIYLFPPGNYSANYDRTIVTIGYGYDVDTLSEGSAANGGLQNIKGNLNVAITLVTGSDNSIFEGIDGFYIRNTGARDTKGIIVSRCKGTIQFFGWGHSEWKVSQSIISILISGANFLQNFLVSNCVIDNFQSNNTYAGQSAVFMNNVFTGDWNNGNIPCLYKNNIFLAEGSFGLEAGSTYEYNVFVADITSGKGQHNKFKVNSGSIFNGYPDQKSFSNDKRWEIKNSSVAKTSGENSTECGIFGGDDPYHLSGIPPIPAFYKLTAPSSTATSNPYTITFSVRGNN